MAKAKALKLPQGRYHVHVIVNARGVPRVDYFELWTPKHDAKPYNDYATGARVNKTLKKMFFERMTAFFS
jgi:hypothetical protein